MIIKANSFSKIQCWDVSFTKSYCWSRHSKHPFNHQRDLVGIKGWYDPLVDMWGGEMSESWSISRPWLRRKSWSKVWFEDDVWSTCWGADI